MIIISCLVAATDAIDVHGQGNFTNLDFESAYGLPNPPPTQPSLEPVANALPGWTVYEGQSTPTEIFFNGISAGGVLVTLVGTNGSGIPPALAGNYSVTLDAGEGSSGNIPASIVQSGTIPASAESLTFIASGDVSDGNGYLTLSFNGQNIPFTTLSTGQTYNTYGADISGLAGQMGQLGFTENPGTYIFGITYLDNIQFTSSTIPEPGTWALILFGAGLIGVGKALQRRLTV